MLLLLLLVPLPMITVPPGQMDGVGDEDNEVE